MSEDKKQDFSGELKESAHKIWLAGLGALSVAEEEGGRVFKSLVDKGSAYETRGREKVDEVKAKVEDAAERAKEQAESTWSKIESRIESAVAAAFNRAGVPSRDEIATLTQRVEELTKLVERLKPTADA